MRKLTLDLEALRSFVMGIELGSFARAAQHLNRSTSAVSAHLKKLEEQIGHALVIRDGRHVKLTSTGEQLMLSAKRLLELNDETFYLLAKGEMKGQIRLGLQEDFGEQVLTETLARFSRTFPDVEIEVKVARNGPLREGLSSGNLDLALLWTSEPSSDALVIGEFPMEWIASNGYHPILDKPLPLVLFERPCLLRECALQALEEHAINWRISLTSQSLAGVWSAVDAGLGVTVRTVAGMPNDLMVIKGERLPALPSLALALGYADKPKSEVVLALEETLYASLRIHFPDYIRKMDSD